MTLPWSLGPRPSDLCHILARFSPWKSPVPWDRSSWVSGVTPSRILLSCPCLYLASVAPLSILSLRSGFAPLTEGAPRKVSGFFPPVKIRPVESGGPWSGAPPGLAGRVRDKCPVARCPQFPLGPHGGARWAGTRGPCHLCTPAAGCSALSRLALGASLREGPAWASRISGGGRAYGVGPRWGRAD